ncbi:MAG: DsbA family protein [Silicimonas sp.]|nr:DsbA family protein [Silicimonas sp.]
MTRSLTALLALGAIALAGAYFMAPSSNSTDPFGAAFAQSADEIDTSSIIDMRLGNAEAAVTVVEYASFTCGHCANFHAENYKKLKADFIDTGLINFIHREVYFDRPGLWAGITARCGENADSRYFGIIDMIYAQQRNWASADNSPQQMVDALRKIGKTAGLADADLDACFADGDRAQALYAFFVKNTEADKINSTPSFVINGTLHSNMPYEELKALIEGELEG